MLVSDSRIKMEKDGCQLVSLEEVPSRVAFALLILTVFCFLDKRLVVKAVQK